MKIRTRGDRSGEYSQRGFGTDCLLPRNATARRLLPYSAHAHLQESAHPQRRRQVPQPHTWWFCAILVDTRLSWRQVPELKSAGRTLQAGRSWLRCSASRRARWSRARTCCGRATCSASRPAACARRSSPTATPTASCGTSASASPRWRSTRRRYATATARQRWQRSAHHATLDDHPHVHRKLSRGFPHAGLGARTASGLLRKDAHPSGADLRRLSGEDANLSGRAHRLRPESHSWAPEKPCKFYSLICTGNH